METTTKSTTKTNLADFEKEFADILSTSDRGNGKRDLYNYNGKILSAVIDSTQGDKKKARQIFRKKVEKIAFAISQSPHKKELTAQFWNKFADNFISKTICSDTRQNPYVSKLQELINQL